MKVSEGRTENGVGGVITDGNCGGNGRGNRLPRQKVKNDPGGRDQNHLQNAEGGCRGKQGVERQPDEQGRCKMLSQAAIVDFWNLVVSHHVDRKGRRQRALKPATVGIIPKNLIENALIERCVKRIVAMKNQYQTNPKEDDRRSHGQSKPRIFVPIERFYQSTSPN